MTNNYTIDQTIGLTQVLQDGTASYVYGLGRIAEDDGTDWMYYLADGLGSVRQLTDETGVVLMAQGYEPYGSVLYSFGDAHSNYGYAGEWTDTTGLQYLRARYLDTGIGRFISRDTWAGDYNNPLSLNKWMYVQGNPINLIDPTGMFSDYGVKEVNKHWVEFHDLNTINFIESFGLHPTTIAAAIAVQIENNGNPFDWGWNTLKWGLYKLDIAGDDKGLGPAKTNQDQLLDKYFSKLNLTLECQTQFKAKVEDENFDPYDWSNAIKAMTIRIARSTQYCNNCTPKDKLIIAAMAQNTGFVMDPWIWNMYSIEIQPKLYAIDWEKYFFEDNNAKLLDMDLVDLTGIFLGGCPSCNIITPPQNLWNNAVNIPNLVPGRSGESRPERCKLIWG